MMEKKEAARVLKDELCDISCSLEKAYTLMEELTDGYFRIYGNNAEKGRAAIIWEYPRRGLYADIVEDYIYQAKKDIESLKGAAEECLN